MPTIPYPQSRVERAPLPGVRVSTDTPSGAFGVGSAVDLSGPAKLAQQIVEEHAANADQVAINTATVAAHEAKQKRLFDPQSGALNARGVNALPATDAAKTGWQEDVGTIESGLANDRQKTLFRERATSMFYDLSDQLDRHAHQELLAHDKQQSESLLDIAKSAAVANIGDPAKLENAVASVRAIVTDYGRRNGWTPEQLQDATAQRVSETHLAVVEQLLAAPEDKGGGDLRASAYVAAHRAELVGQDLTRADQLTDAGSVHGAAQRAGDAITKTAKTLQDGLAEAGKITDARVREATEHRVRQHFADVSAALREDQTQAFHSASSIVERTGTFEAVPLSLRIKMSPEENGALQHRADQMQHPERVTDPETYMSLLNAAGLSDWTRQGFATLNLGKYRNALSEQDFNRLLALQLQIRSQSLTGEATEAGRQARAAAEQAKKTANRSAAIERAIAVANANETDPAKRAATERTIRAAMGPAPGTAASAAPSAPGAPIQYTAPGAPPPNFNAAPSVVIRAVPGKGVPQSWIDHAQRDANYRTYLKHMGVITVDEPGAAPTIRPTSTGDVDLRTGPPTPSSSPPAAPGLTQPTAAPSAPASFRDSVTAITGKPTLGVHEVPTLVAALLSRGHAASYSPILDHAVVDKSATPREKDVLFSHEMGHRLDSLLHGDRALSAAFDAAVTATGAKKPTGYAATNRSEHFAEAFANAVDVLRDMNTSALTRPQAVTMMHAAEQHVPGTQVLAKYLLDHPLYAHHPAQQFRGDGGPPTAGVPAGLLTPGNIDLTNRPRVKNPDGSISTVRSISVEQDGKEILIPTVSPDGKILTNDQAIARYEKTGEHLGIFKDAASATVYAKQLHESQAAAIAPPETAPSTAQLAPINVSAPRTPTPKPVPGVPYEKSGHMVVDTPRPDSAGHVPTHRIDQPTNRRPDETWTQYEDRVLSQTSKPADEKVRSNLTALDPDVQPAAAAIITAAKEDGITITPRETTRTQSRQEHLFRQGRANSEPVATWTLTSDHTLGRAIDFTGTKKAFAWLEKNAARFGFVTLGALDPGHVSMPTQATVATAATSQRAGAPR